MMQQTRNYTEDEIVRDLCQKFDIKIPRNVKKIFCLCGPRSKGDIGNKTKGKIDFLVKNHGYVRVDVEQFT